MDRTDGGAGVELADVQAALDRIRAHVHCTPVITSGQLDRLTGARVHFKCENLQKVGAFKARGALNAVLSLEAPFPKDGSPKERPRKERPPKDGSPEGGLPAVATHSSGNHGAALAMAAGVRGMAAHIVMPNNAPAVKKEAVAGYGGNIIECEPTLPARESTLAQLLADTGAHPVHPYDDPRIIAGQGTVALELLEQVQGLDAVVVPVGGGGLLSGVATAVRALSPDTRVIAAEPAGADDAYRSFTTGRLVPQENPRTMADGLLTSLGRLNFAIIRERVDAVLTVSEDSILKAMRLQWTRLKSVVEPSGAVSFAAILEHPEEFRGARVGCVISGGNLDPDRWPFLNRLISDR